MADHKVLGKENESRVQHPSRSRGTGSSFSLYSKQPNEKQDCARDDDKLAKVLAARSEPGIPTSQLHTDQTQTELPSTQSEG